MRDGIFAMSFSLVYGGCSVLGTLMRTFTHTRTHARAQMHRACTPGTVGSGAPGGLRLVDVSKETYMYYNCTEPPPPKDEDLYGMGFG